MRPATRPKSTASLSIGNSIAEMHKVADFVESFAEAHRLPAYVINAVNLCLDELLNNTISYGYADQGPHVISVRLAVEDDVLVAELEDDAKPFDPRRPRGRQRPRSGDIGRRHVGKLGLRLVNALMDDVDYVRSGDYNRVRLAKKLPKAELARQSGVKA